MGCCNSSPKVSPASHVSNPEESLIRDMICTTVDENQIINMDHRGKITSNFGKIISGVKTIANPKNMRPIFCFSNDAFPIICCGIQIDDHYFIADQIDRANSGISVPIVSASNSKLGQIVCISQLQLLSQECLTNGNTIALIINSFNWISNGNAMNSLIYVYSPHFEFIQSNLKTIGITCKPCFNISNTDFSQAQILIVTTDSDINNNHDQIKLISSKGCGVVVFYSQFTSNINHLLQNYGLAYSDIILNVDRTVDTPISACNLFSAIKDVNFPCLYMRLISLLLQNKVDFCTLDDTIAAIRYYINVCTSNQLPQIKIIVGKSIDFLKRTQYKDSNSICFTVGPKLIVILLQQIFQKIPLTLLPSIDCNELMYINAMSFDEVNTELSIDIRSMHWTTTGLWLPPDKTASICVKTAIDDQIFIQIGSHSQKLFELKEEWKRWPYPIITTQLTSQSEIKLKSPFGGIVYFTYITPNDEIQTKTITFQANRMCYYPRYSYLDESVYNNTKDSSVPWAEIETEFIIFTLPAFHFKKIDSENLFDEINTKLAIVCNNISTLLSSDRVKQLQARVVFDVQLGNVDTGYPIFDHVDHVESVLIESFQNQPTMELWRIIYLYTLLFIKEGVFDKNKEILFAQFIAVIAIQTVFPKFNVDSLQPLENSLSIVLQINSKYDRSIINAFKYVMNDPSANMDSNWIKFLTNLSNTAKRNFFPIFDLADNAPKEVNKFGVFKLSK